MSLTVGPQGGQIVQGKNLLARQLLPLDHTHYYPSTTATIPSHCSVSLLYFLMCASFLFVFLFFWETSATIVRCFLLKFRGEIFSLLLCKCVHESNSVHLPFLFILRQNINISWILRNLYCISTLYIHVSALLINRWAIVMMYHFTMWVWSQVNAPSVALWWRNPSKMTGTHNLGRRGIFQDDAWYHS